MAPAIPATAGRLYSLATTAPWDNCPPLSMICPPNRPKMGVQPGSGLLVTMMSPAWTLLNWHGVPPTLTGPRLRPGWLWRSNGCRILGLERE